MPQLQCEEIRFPSADGVHTVAASMYTMPGVPERAVLPLSHGMSENEPRYRPKAQWTAQRGLALAGRGPDPLRLEAGPDHRRRPEPDRSDPQLPVQGLPRPLLCG